MTRAILIGNLQGKRRTCACEPAQSKRAWTFHKSHFFTRAILYSNLQGKCRTQSPRPVLCEPAQSKCTWAFHKSHFVQKFTGKMPDVSPAANVLREPAQSTCTWTCHKRHFVGKFTVKMPNESDTTSIEHRPLTITVRTPQCGHTVWGKKIPGQILQAPFVKISVEEVLCRSCCPRSLYKAICTRCL